MASNSKKFFNDSARQLTLNAAKDEWNRKHPAPGSFRRTDADGTVIDATKDPSGVAPGFELLYSFYAPNLGAISEHPTRTIAVRQTVNHGTDTLVLSSTQGFVVIAPQFSLPEGDVHSVYPTQGVGVKAPILPHIVFNDPHLPWEREIIPPSDEINLTRNKVPWLALMAFTAVELLLTQAELSGSSKIFVNDIAQSSTLSVTQKISDLRAISSQNAKHCIPDSADGTTSADFIFMTPQVFGSYFLLDSSKVEGGAVQGKPDVVKYKFLAHTRAINTAGMANAGVQDDGLYSVIVSPRCGLWTNTKPETIYVHLVSIDCVDTIQPWPLTGTNHVALCSLYSWTYRCLPPLSLDIADALQELADTKDTLGPSSLMYQPLLKDNSSVLKMLLGQRLKDGFALTRYKVQTGEETAAFLRGPLTPTAVPHPITPSFSMQSTYSTDLQILDRTLGIMDITYSAAWQLGRTLGLADQSFFTALGRLRTAIYGVAIDRAKKDCLGSSERSATTLLKALPATFQRLKILTANHEPSLVSR